MLLLDSKKTYSAPYAQYTKLQPKCLQHGFSLFWIKLIFRQRSSRTVADVLTGPLVVYSAAEFTVQTSHLGEFLDWTPRTGACSWYLPYTVACGASGACQTQLLSLFNPRAAVGMYLQYFHDDRVLRGLSRCVMICCRRLLGLNGHCVGEWPFWDNTEIIGTVSWFSGQIHFFVVLLPLPWAADGAELTWCLEYYFPACSWFSVHWVLLSDSRRLHCLKSALSFLEGSSSLDGHQKFHFYFCSLLQWREGSREAGQIIQRCAVMCISTGSHSGVRGPFILPRQWKPLSEHIRQILPRMWVISFPLVFRIASEICSKLECNELKRRQFLLCRYRCRKSSRNRLPVQGKLATFSSSLNAYSTPTSAADRAAR